MSKLGEAYVDFGANLSPLKKGIAEAKGLASSAGKSIGGALMAGLGALGVAFAGFKFFETAISSFAEAEAAEKGLASALRSTGQEVDGNLAKMSQFAGQLQKVTTLDDEASMGLMKQAVNYGATADEAMNLVKAASGLAAVTGGDAAGALAALSKASNGSLMALQKMHPQLKGITDQEELLAAAQQLAQQGMQQEIDKTETLAGSWEQAKQQVGNLFEAIGGMLAPALMGLVGGLQNTIGYLQSIIQYFTSASDETEKLATTTESTGSVVGSVFSAIGGFLDALLFAFMNFGSSAELAGLTVARAFTGAYDRVSWFFEQIGVALSWFGENWQGVFTDVFNFTTTIFSNLGKNIMAAFDNVSAWLSGDFSRGVTDGMVSLTDGFTSAIKSGPKWTEFASGDMSKALDEDIARVTKTLEKEWDKWSNIKSENMGAMSKEEKDATTKVGTINVKRPGGEKNKDKDKDNKIEFVGFAESWKKLQQSLNKDKDKTAEKQLAETKKQTDLLKKIADRPGLELEDEG